MNNVEKLTPREVQWGGEMYKLALDLRDRELRKPLGLSVYDDPLDAEVTDLHFAVCDGDRPVAYGIATPTDGRTARVRQVVVEPDRRGQGVGRMLMEYIEQSLAAQGFEEIFLHARATAEGFYSRLGYLPRGERFTEVGIPHVEMYKPIGQR